MDKLYCWGFMGSNESVLGCNSIVESWLKLLDNTKEMFGEYDPENCKVVNIVDGKFCVYDAWEI